MTCGACYSLALRLAARAAAHSWASLIICLVSGTVLPDIVSSHPQSGLVSSGLSSYHSPRVVTRKYVDNKCSSPRVWGLREETAMWA